MRVRTRTIIVLSIAIIFAISASIFVASYMANSDYFRDIPSREEVPDDLIISRANARPEVKMFLERYPNAWVDPRGASHFAAEYHINTTDLTNETIDDSYPYKGYLTLQVGLDDQGFPTRTALWCTNERYGQHKIEVNGNDIAKFLDEEICRIL